jgi:hypothetical protein
VLAAVPPPTGWSVGASGVTAPAGMLPRGDRHLVDLWPCTGGQGMWTWLGIHQLTTDDMMSPEQYQDIFSFFARGSRDFQRGASQCKGRAPASIYFFLKKKKHSLKHQTRLRTYYVSAFFSLGCYIVSKKRFICEHF